MIKNTFNPFYEVDQTLLALSLRSDRLSLIRGAAMIFANLTSHSIEEWTKAFNRSESSLDRLRQRFLQRAADNEEIQAQYQKFEEIARHFAVLQT